MSDIGRFERRLLDERRGLLRPDQIEIYGLRVFAHHGVFEEEQTKGQPFVLDMVLDADTHIAARTDDLGDAVDYSRVVNEVAELVRSTRFNLLEALAARVADHLLGFPRIAVATVRICKPEVELDEQIDRVAVTVRRARPIHL